MNLLKGYRTYIVALGLVCLGLYRLSANDFAGAWEPLLEGLVAIFGRSAISDLLALLKGG